MLDDITNGDRARGRVGCMSRAPRLIAIQSSVADELMLTWRQGFVITADVHEALANGSIWKV
jgi:hypothetical protein